MRVIVACLASVTTALPGAMPWDNILYNRESAAEVAAETPAPALNNKAWSSFLYNSGRASPPDVSKSFPGLKEIPNVANEIYASGDIDSGLKAIPSADLYGVVPSSVSRPGDDYNFPESLAIDAVKVAVTGEAEIAKLNREFAAEVSAGEFPEDPVSDTTVSQMNGEMGDVTRTKMDSAGIKGRIDNLLFKGGKLDPSLYMDSLGARTEAPESVREKREASKGANEARRNPDIDNILFGRGGMGTNKKRRGKSRGSRFRSKMSALLPVDVIDPKVQAHRVQLRKARADREEYVDPADLKSSGHGSWTSFAMVGLLLGCFVSGKMQGRDKSPSQKYGKLSHRNDEGDTRIRRNRQRLGHDVYRVSETVPPSEVELEDMSEDKGHPPAPQPSIITITSDLMAKSAGVIRRFSSESERRGSGARRGSSEVDIEAKKRGSDAGGELRARAYTPQLGSRSLAPRNSPPAPIRSTNAPPSDLV